MSSNSFLGHPLFAVETQILQWRGNSLSKIGLLFCVDDWVMFGLLMFLLLLGTWGGLPTLHLLQEYHYQHIRVYVVSTDTDAASIAIILIADSVWQGLSSSGMAGHPTILGMRIGHGLGGNRTCTNPSVGMRYILFYGKSLITMSHGIWIIGAWKIPFIWCFQLMLCGYCFCTHVPSVDIMSNSRSACASNPLVLLFFPRLINKEYKAFSLDSWKKDIATTVSG